MDLGLGGKGAIITGGSLGIGKAIARELAREGADVAIVARTKDTLETAAQELAAETGRRVIPLVADVTSRPQVDAMVAQAAAQLGGLHILVNSGSPPGGSATATGPIETVVDEDLLHDFNVKYVSSTSAGPTRAMPATSAAERATPPSCTSPRRWPSSSAASGSRSTASTPASRARSAPRACSRPGRRSWASTPPPWRRPTSPTTRPEVTPSGAWSTRTEAPRGPS